MPPVALLRRSPDSAASRWGQIRPSFPLNAIVRAKVGTGTLRVIVPDYAKSAGTLIALGADRIVMGETSELGPIDPQITLSDGSGNRISTPVLGYIEAYRRHAAALAANPEDVVARVMLSKFDPARLVLFEAAVNRAQLFAERQLKQGCSATGATGPPPMASSWTPIAGSLTAR